MMMRALATVVSVDEARRPTILLDGCAEGGEVAALRASGYNPQPGDRCVVAKLGMRFIAEYAVDGPLSAGLSAYEVAVENGFSGTEAEWLQSLVGPAGQNGQNGLNGQNGASAYLVAVANGFSGTEAQWLASLHGADGAGFSISAGRFAPIVCDFLSANAYGNAPLVGAAVNAGSCAISSPEAGHPGVVHLSAGSGTNSGFLFATDLGALLIAGGEIFEVVFKLHNIQSMLCRFGLHDALSHLVITDGIWIEVYPVTDTQAAVRAKTVSNASQSVTGTSCNISTQTWYRARFEVNADATSVDFELYAEDGTLLWSESLSNNLPTGADRFVGVNVLATYGNGGSSRIVYLDRVSFEINRDLIR